jgi:hypothetical protein
MRHEVRRECGAAHGFGMWGSSASTRLQLGKRHADDDVRDCCWRRDDAVSPEYRAADEPLERVARCGLCYLCKCEVRRLR